MKITVTGGKGFIGEATARIAKERGHEVAFFDRRDGNDILGPLDALDGSDTIIHLAGVLGTHELFDTVQDAIDVNITGSYRIMDWCLRNDANYVGILMPDVFPSIYTATKVATQRIAKALHHSRGLKVSHVRAFNVFGPGQAVGPGHPQKLVPTAAVAAWRNEPIQVWGDGKQGVDLIYADDVARMLLDAARFRHNEVFDGGTGSMWTVNNVVAMIKNIARSSSLVSHEPMRDGEEPTHIVARGDGWDLLGWEPTFNFEDLIQTVEAYKP